MATYQTHDELDDRPATTSGPRRRRPSLFGMLSAVAGAAALAVVYRDRVPDALPYKTYLFNIPQYDYAVQAYHVAAAGAALAVLALLWRRVSGRTRAGWPVLGLLLCGAAAGVYRYETSPRYPGTPEHWVQVNVVERVQRLLNKQEPAGSPKVIETSSSSAAAPADPQPAPATTPSGSGLFPGT